MQVARDKDGTLHLFPDNFGTACRKDDHWELYTFASIIKGDIWLGSVIDNSLFPELTWEDSPLKVKLVALNPIHKIICPQCNKEIKYRSSDIQHKSIEYPWSGYTEESEWITCPHCKKDIRV